MIRRKWISMGAKMSFIRKYRQIWEVQLDGL